MKLSDWTEDHEATKEERDWIIGSLARVKRAMANSQEHVDVTIDGRSVIWMRKNYDLLDDEFFDPSLILAHAYEYLTSALAKNDKLFAELGVEIDDKTRESERGFIEERIRAAV